jgi:hypothetical protein
MAPDTTNKFLVAMRGDGLLAPMRPVQLLRKSDALNLAAWLVAMADDNDEFPALLEAVRNT